MDCGVFCMAVQKLVELITMCENTRLRLMFLNPMKRML